MFEIKFEINNAAFDAGSGYERDEMVRILEKITEEIKEGYNYHCIRDINGNKIGNWEVK